MNMLPRIRPPERTGVHHDERLVCLDPAQVAAAFGWDGSEYVDDRFVCGTRVDGTDQEQAKFPGFAEELQADLMSAGAVLAAQNNEEASGTPDVLASLMAKEARAGQKVVSGGKANRSDVMRDSDAMQVITEHHCPAMAARAGVLQVNALSFEMMRVCMKVYLDQIIREAVAITQHAGRNTMLDSDVLSAAISRLGRVKTKILCRKAGICVCGARRRQMGRDLPGSRWEPCSPGWRPLCTVCCRFLI